MNTSICCHHITVATMFIAQSYTKHRTTYVCCYGKQNFKQLQPFDEIFPFGLEKVSSGMQPSWNSVNSQTDIARRRDGLRLCMYKISRPQSNSETFTLQFTPIKLLFVCAFSVYLQAGMCEASDNVERLVDGTRVQQQCSAMLRVPNVYHCLVFLFRIYGFMRIVKSSHGNEQKKMLVVPPINV